MPGVFHLTLPLRLGQEGTHGALALSARKEISAPLSSSSAKAEDPRPDGEAGKKPGASSNRLGMERLFPGSAGPDVLGWTAPARHRNVPSLGRWNLS